MNATATTSPVSSRSATKAQCLSNTSWNSSAIESRSFLEKGTKSQFSDQAEL